MFQMLKVLMEDNGVSHCFVSYKLVQQLGLPVHQKSPFREKLRDGRCLESSELCPNFAINLSSLTIAPNCYVFLLGSANIVLGISWLGTLGNVKMNWQNLTMRFVYHK